MSVDDAAYDVTLVDLLQEKGPAWSAAVSSLDAATMSRLGATSDPRSRRRLVTGRAHLRRLASARLAVPADDITIAATCTSCGGPHGVPVVTSRDGRSLSASISHAGGSVLVAVADTESLGIDLVEVAEAEFEGFEATVLSPVERAALLRPAVRVSGWRARVWAAKEAVLKATGHGLRVPLHDVTLPLGDPAGPGTAIVQTGTGTSRVQVRPLVPGRGLAAAAARVCGSHRA